MRHQGLERLVRLPAPDTDHGDAEFGETGVTNSAASMIQLAFCQRAALSQDWPDLLVADFFNNIRQKWTYEF